MHRLGRISGVMALIIILLVPTLICLKYRIFPPMQNIISGLVNITVIFLPIAVGEVLAFTPPMLGSGASYLSFVSGNIGNLKIPCAVMSMDIAGVSPTTKEGDIISTISVAVSTMVTTLILIVGMLAIVPLTPLLSAPALAPAFEHICRPSLAAWDLLDHEAVEAGVNSAADSSGDHPLYLPVRWCVGPYIGNNLDHCRAHHVQKGWVTHTL